MHRRKVICTKKGSKRKKPRSDLCWSALRENMCSCPRALFLSNILWDHLGETGLAVYINRKCPQEQSFLVLPEATSGYSKSPTWGDVALYRLFHVRWMFFSTERWPLKLGWHVAAAESQHKLLLVMDEKEAALSLVLMESDLSGETLPDVPMFTGGNDAEKLHSANIFFMMPALQSSNLCVATTNSTFFTFLNICTKLEQR